MTRELLCASKQAGEQARFLLEIFQEGEHWTSTLAQLDAQGQPMPSAVAPRFYGLSEEQARRRMLSVLENQYDEVRSLGAA